MPQGETTSPSIVPQYPIVNVPFRPSIRIKWCFHASFHLHLLLFIIPSSSRHAGPSLVESPTAFDRAYPLDASRTA